MSGTKMTKAESRCLRSLIIEARQTARDRVRVNLPHRVDADESAIAELWDWINLHTESRARS